MDELNIGDVLLGDEENLGNITEEEGTIGDIEEDVFIDEGIKEHNRLEKLDYEQSGHTGFQAEIEDLDEIRSGAEAGATAVQDEDYVHTDNNYTDGEKEKLDDLENYDDTEIRQRVTNAEDDIDDLETTVAGHTTAISQKADRNELPTKVSDLQNDSNFITNTVNNLINYYLKSETYTKTEVNNLIGQIQTVHIEVVQTLPTTGQSNIIYFVPKEDSETGDIYNEYIWINNTWELIGSTQIDLTGYATESWVNNQGFIKQHQDITGKEDKANKVTTINGSSTDTQYPSAKAVYTLFNSIVDGDEVSY